MERFYEDYLDRLIAFHEQMKNYIVDLPDEAADWVPGEEMNSVAVLVVHTMGSEAYWVGQLSAGVNANRVRATEFETRGLSIAELVTIIDKAVENVKTWVATLTIDDLSRMVLSSMMDQEVSVGWALLHALDHIAQHTGHMGITRQLWDRQ